jgi:hypothetical protein
MRVIAIIVTLAFTSAVAAPKPQPLLGKELADFLGPVSPNLIHWSKCTLVDFWVYNGQAMPPLSGRVGIYIGGHPSFEPDPGSTAVNGRLGIFPVKWYRSVTEKGFISEQGLVQLDRYWVVDIRFTAQRQEDVDRLAAIVSQLPMFTRTPARD